MDFKLFNIIILVRIKRLEIIFPIYESFFANRFKRVMTNCKEYFYPRVSELNLYENRRV